MDFFRDISKMSALTNTDLKIPKAREDIGNAQPLSYVPFRNLLLLTTAAGWAESIGAEHLFYGAVQTDDYSGYWDCTSMFLNKVNDVYGLNRKNQFKLKLHLCSSLRSKLSRRVLICKLTLDRLILVMKELIQLAVNVFHAQHVSRALLIIRQLTRFSIRDKFLGRNLVVKS